MKNPVAENLEALLPDLQIYLLPVDMGHVNDAYKIVKNGLKDSDRCLLGVRLSAINNALKFSEEYNKEADDKSFVARELLKRTACYIYLATITN